MATIYTTDTSGRITATNSAIPTGNTITNTTTETFFTDPQVLIPSSMWYPGRVFEINLYGSFGTAVVVPSIRGKIYLGSTVLGDTGSVPNAVSIGNKQWSGISHMTVISTGTTGTIEYQGFIMMQTTLGNSVMMPTGNSSLITVDMTIDQILKMSVQWSALSTSNTITLRQMILRG